MVAYGQIHGRILLTEDNKRPNANYNLSYPDNADAQKDGIVYHYSRERRLSSAPDDVKNIYKKDQKPGRFSLFGSLVADKPRRTLFVIIVLLCIAILMLSRFGYFDTTYMLGGNKLDISGTIFEDNTIILIKKTIENSDVYTGAVDIVVSVPMKLDEETMEEEYPVFEHRIFFTMEKTEDYRFAVPFNEPELLIVLQNERSAQVQIKFKPE